MKIESLKDITTSTLEEAKLCLCKSDIEDYDTYKFNYVLKKLVNGQLDDVMAIAHNENCSIMFNPFHTETENGGIFFYSDWAYNYEDDFFKFLEEGYEIDSMTMEGHYNVWSTIYEWRNEEFYYPIGLQNYIHYCKTHNVTKEKIDQVVELDVSDIMNLYEVPNRQKEHSSRNYER